MDKIMSYDNSLQEGPMDSDHLISTAGWTRTQPRSDGYYWWRMGTDGDADPCEVKDGRVWDFGEPASLPLNGLGGEWLGPISPADAEQLAELRRVAGRACDWFAWYVGPRDEDAPASSLEVFRKLAAVLNPKPEKETR